MTFGKDAEKLSDHLKEIEEKAKHFGPKIKVNRVHWRNGYRLVSGTMTICDKPYGVCRLQFISKLTDSPKNFRILCPEKECTLQLV
jgi:hypothetical protein